MHRLLGRRGWQRGLILAVAGVVALVLVGFASAAITTYYGYNYLSPGLPNDHCAPYQGRPCSAFNNWDFSHVDKVNGGCINVGFQGVGESFEDYLTFCSGWNGLRITVSKYDVGANGYNRGVCKYSSGNSSYVRCQVEY